MCEQYVLGCLSFSAHVWEVLSTSSNSFNSHGIQKYSCPLAPILYGCWHEKSFIVGAAWHEPICTQIGILSDLCIMVHYILVWNYFERAPWYWCKWRSWQTKLVWDLLTSNIAFIFVRIYKSWYKEFWDWRQLSTCLCCSKDRAMHDKQGSYIQGGRLL